MSPIFIRGSLSWYFNSAHIRAILKHRRTIANFNILTRVKAYLNTLSILIHCRTIPYINTLPKPLLILIHFRSKAHLNTQVEAPFRETGSIPYLKTWEGPPATPHLIDAISYHSCPLISSSEIRRLSKVGFS